jgi:biopolymer transport protein ExbB
MESNWFESFWNNSDYIGHSVFFILVAMSTLSWMQIIIKALHALYRSRTHKIVKEFWMQSTIEKALRVFEKKLGKKHIFTNIASDAIFAAKSFDEQKHSGISKNFDRPKFIASTIRQTLNEASTKLESGMTILASIGSVAPFVGLFGTVYGIYKALIDIAKTGSANLATVSGPIGESLIMTAAGLFVAIPAVLAYNSFVRSNNLEMVEANAFAHDLHSFLNIGTISNND